MPQAWSKSEAPLTPPPPQHAAGIPVSSAEVSRALETILAAPEFANAVRLREFLSFLVEEALGGADSIKEVTVAMRVFKRRASFDSAGDSVVRVNALHLRNRLRDYYAGSGSLDEVVIEVPKGTYLPVFRRADAGGGTAGAPVGVPVVRRSVLSRKAMAAGAALLTLLATSALWAIRATARLMDP